MYPPIFASAFVVLLKIAWAGCSGWGNTSNAAAKPFSTNAAAWCIAMRCGRVLNG
ncbi:hypothetical protein PR003_g25008 [Phytophthora rubi]|uniref:Uncharacterized protein n=1 Tax=Phytophthora rubi TaxID=129364 RepID=A0A6A4CSJ7_9STRA|nr:hypothetical protein PR001_g21847 [Phytophthora rubi]KAE9291536.1 hypothetical protein PR003_g25008 [Phytophthora rubi]